MTYYRKVCAQLVSKVNIQKSIMWSKKQRRCRVDGEIMSQLSASFHPEWFEFEESQRMHLTYVCCQPFNMLVCDGLGIRLVGVTGTVFVLHNCIATRK